ncbi:hypothetical protein MUP37_02945 [Candidatus Bathyarchaeota archaeon]|jgi:hypothetical protein|nr:hypothetical protein [Candidatus Bathyarchaeota archaeon]
MTQNEIDRSAIDRRLGRRVYFCSVKGFYCGRAKRTQTKLCPDCPTELKEKENGMRAKSSRTMLNS